MSNTLFSKTLLAVDDSQQSQRAVEKAAQLAKEGALGKIVLLNVYNTADIDYTKLHSRDKLDELRAQSLILLKNYAEVFKKNGIEPELKRAGGEPSALILDLLDNDKEFDLIIMGSRKLNKFQELVFGSVSDRVMRLANIPVLIIK